MKFIVRPTVFWTDRNFGFALKPFAGASTSLWQVQLAGNNTDCFTFKVLAVAKEALREHPNPQARDLRSLDTVLQTRLIVGSPAQAGPSDPDGVGLVAWKLAIYSSSIEEALDFIHFILAYKTGKSLLDAMPLLVAHVLDADAPALPQPWQLGRGVAVADMPAPFSVLPPRGRRHVLAQLDKEEEAQGPEQHQGQSQEGGNTESDGERTAHATSYLLTFRGAIYQFKDRFDSNAVPGTLVSTDNSNHKDYVRYLKLQAGDEIGMQRVRVVLDDVLQGLPVYFINMTGDGDEMAAALTAFPSVLLAETPAA